MNVVFSIPSSSARRPSRRQHGLEYRPDSERRCPYLRSDFPGPRVPAGDSSVSSSFSPVRRLDRPTFGRRWPVSPGSQQRFVAGGGALLFGVVVLASASSRKQFHDLSTRRRRPLRIRSCSDDKSFTPKSLQLEADARPDGVALLLT